MRFISLLILGGAAACYSAENDLAGKWVGTWLDTRPNTGNSGGPLWAEAVADGKDVWKVVFRISKTHSYNVVFKGKRDGDSLKFSGFANAGDARGMYYWTAVLGEKELSGTYEGPDEKGTFKLARDTGKKLDEKPAEAIKK